MKTFHSTAFSRFCVGLHLLKTVNQHPPGLYPWFYGKQIFHDRKKKQQETVTNREHLHLPSLNVLRLFVTFGKDLCFTSGANAVNRKRTWR